MIFIWSTRGRSTRGRSTRGRSTRGRFLCCCEANTQEPSLCAPPLPAIMRTRGRSIRGRFLCCCEANTQEPSLCAPPLPAIERTRGRAKRSSCPESNGRRPHLTGQAFSCAGCTAPVKPSPMCFGSTSKPTHKNCPCVRHFSLQLNAQGDGSSVPAARQQ